jgi:hypothetical protein
MAKRSDGQFERRDRDYYATPPPPILRLIPHIQDIRTFAEPMCGDGAIIRVLEARGWSCPRSWDLEPQGDMIGRAGTWPVEMLREEDFDGCDAVISNPPWPMPVKSRPQGTPDGWPSVGIIAHLMRFRPTWMLLAADFMHNVYFRELEPHCVKIVSVGRVKWIEGSENTGKDNAAWYLFDADHAAGPVYVGNRPPAATYHPDIEGVL